MNVLITGGTSAVGRQLVQMLGRTIKTQQLEQNDENQALFDIVVETKACA